jgi:hypothetical protein
MTRKRAVVLVLAALMAATTIFPASAYALGDTLDDPWLYDTTYSVVVD